MTRHVRRHAVKDAVLFARQGLGSPIVLPRTIAALITFLTMIT